MSRRSPRTHARRLLLSFACLLFCAHAARAAEQTYVSAKGNDANSCQPTAPCRTFAGALAKTSLNGEVIVLDPGEYGPFTVTFSVSVTADGVYAGVTVVDADAVTIKPAAGSAVALRGLTLKGHGDSRGIVYVGPEVAREGNTSEITATVHVEGCTLSGFGTPASGFESAAARFEGNGHIFIKDTTVRNSGLKGLHFVTTGWQKMSATVVNSRLERNQTGLYALGSDNSKLSVTARDTVSAGNKDNEQGVGFLVSNAELFLQDCVSTHHAWGVNVIHSSHATINGCLLSFNDTGLWVYGSSTVRLSDTTISHNKMAIHAFESQEADKVGKVYSFGNNHVAGNTFHVKGNPVIPVNQL